MRGDVAARITEEKGGLVELSADGRMKTEVSTDRGDITEGTVVTVDLSTPCIMNSPKQAGDSRLAGLTFPAHNS
jgi:hypothetical protein